MDEFPNPKSVIVIDNAKIHHSQELVELVQGYGCKIEWLPPYSPDYNPIEEAFSTIKNWMRRKQEWMEEQADDEYSLLAACSQIDSSCASAYICHAGY